MFIVMPAGHTALIVLMTMEDLVFGVLAAASRRPSLVGGRATAMTLMAVAFALLAAHVFRAFLATRVATAAAGMTRSMIRPMIRSMIGLRKRAHRDQ